MSQLEPKIYVACLAAYNNGILHGDWIDANQDPDDLRDAVHIILKTSPISHAEEWAIHDYEDFDPAYMNENMGMKEVSSIAKFLVEYGELASAVLIELNGDLDQAKDLIENCYQGEFKSEEDFAMSYAEETMEIPDYLASYINYEIMARDLFIDNFMSIELNHKTHVFTHC